MSTAPGPASAPVGNLLEGMPVGDQVIDALRVFAADNAEVVAHLARWLGVGSSDAEAFGAISYAQDGDEPLTPSGLAQVVGLSSGATASMLNRLESAGLVTRTREHRDRRVVTLRVPQHVQEQALSFFSPLRQRVQAMMREHPEEELRKVVALLEQLHEATDDVLSNLQVEPLRH